jgi:hypothetical protein
LTDVAATALRLVASGLCASGRRNAATFALAGFLILLILDPGFLPAIGSLLTSQVV